MTLLLVFYPCPRKKRRTFPCSLFTIVPVVRGLGFFFVFFELYNVSDSCWSCCLICFQSPPWLWGWDSKEQSVNDLLPIVATLWNSTRFYSFFKWAVYLAFKFSWLWTWLLRSISDKAQLSILFHSRVHTKMEWNTTTKNSCQNSVWSNPFWLFWAILVCFVQNRAHFALFHLVSAKNINLQFFFHISTFCWRLK